MGCEGWPWRPAPTPHPARVGARVGGFRRTGLRADSSARRVWWLSRVARGVSSWSFVWTEVHQGGIFCPGNRELVSRGESADLIMATLDVNPDDVHRIAGGWRSYAVEFVAQSPPGVDGGDEWASVAATRDLHDRVHHANNVFRRRLHANADQVDESARNFGQQDLAAAADVQTAGLTGSASGDGMPRSKDMAAIFSGTFKDLSGAMTAGPRPTQLHRSGPRWPRAARSPRRPLSYRRGAAQMPEPCIGAQNKPLTNRPVSPPPRRRCRCRRGWARRVWRLSTVTAVPRARRR